MTGSDGTNPKGSKSGANSRRESVNDSSFNAAMESYHGRMSILRVYPDGRPTLDDMALDESPTHLVDTITHAAFPDDKPMIKEERMYNLGCFKLNKENLLLLLTALGAAIGCLVGALVSVFVGKEAIPQGWLEIIQFPGEMLLRMLRGLVLPLIASSMVLGVTSLDNLKHTGRVAKWSVAYYFATTFIAICLGAALVLVIRPGDRSSLEIITDCKEGEVCDTTASAGILQTFLDLIRNAFPPNVIESFFRAVQSAPDAGSPYGYSLKPKESTNTLGVIVFFLFFGCAMVAVGPKAHTLKTMFDGLFNVVIVLVNLVMWYSPIGIASLIAYQLIIRGLDVFAELAFYILTVMAGLAIHALIVLPLIFFLVTRRNPFSYLYHLVPACLTALGTSSSAATMPVTLKCLEGSLKVPETITRFVIPLGATINMDGTALYEAVGALFIAQAYGLEMTFARVVVVILTAILASIGAAAIPSAGLFTMVLVLEAAGIPTQGIGLILAVDWFLDRFRTTVNVLGDALGCGVVDRLYHGQCNFQPRVSCDEESIGSDDAMSNKA